MGYWTHADESCTIGTFTGQCNVRDARQEYISQHTMMSMVSLLIAIGPLTEQHTLQLEPIGMRAILFSSMIIT